MQLPVLLKGSRYAERAADRQARRSSRRSSADRSKQFYTDWYRPDLMAVVAVGDFDKARSRSSIKSTLLGTGRSAEPKRRADLRRTGSRRHGVTVAHRPGADDHQRRSGLPAAGRDPTDRSAPTGSRWSTACSARCCRRGSTEMAQRPDAPFLGAGTGRGPDRRSHQGQRLARRDWSRRAASTRALEALLTEVERVARFGFTATELERQKLNLLRALRARGRREGQRPVRLAGRRVRPQLPPAASRSRRSTTSSASSQRFLAGHHARRDQQAGQGVVSRAATVWSSCSAPEKAGVALPDEAKLAAVINGGAGADRDGLRRSRRPAALLETLPAPVARSPRRRPVTRSASPSGSCPTACASCSSRRRSSRTRSCSAPSVPAARRSRATRTTSRPARRRRSSPPAASAASAAPICARCWPARSRSPIPFIGELDEGLSGSASPKDLETMFQLIYLRFTQPRADPTLSRRRPRS